MNPCARTAAAAALPRRLPAPKRGTPRLGVGWGVAPVATAPSQWVLLLTPCVRPPPTALSPARARDTVPSRHRASHGHRASHRGRGCLRRGSSPTSQRPAQPVPSHPRPQPARGPRGLCRETPGAGLSLGANTRPLLPPSALLPPSSLHPPSPSKVPDPTSSLTTQVHLFSPPKCLRAPLAMGGQIRGKNQAKRGQGQVGRAVTLRGPRVGARAQHGAALPADARWGRGSAPGTLAARRQQHLRGLRGEPQPWGVHRRFAPALGPPRLP